jgi:hypothetical protein
MVWIQTPCLTSEGKFETLDGVEGTLVCFSDGSDCTSSSDGSSTYSSESGHSVADKRKLFIREIDSGNPEASPGS